MRSRRGGGRNNTACVDVPTTPGVLGAGGKYVGDAAQWSSGKEQIWFRWRKGRREWLTGMRLDHVGDPKRRIAEPPSALKDRCIAAVQRANEEAARYEETRSWKCSLLGAGTKSAARGRPQHFEADPSEWDWDSTIFFCWK